jgi:2-haloacid dehalogenase
MQRYLNLDLYPEAREALDSLKSYKLAILSNGSPQMLQTLIKASGISQLLADLISVDLAKTYKPNLAVYALVEPSLGIAKRDILFVSSNSFDCGRSQAFRLQGCVDRTWRRPGHTHKLRCDAIRVFQAVARPRRSFRTQS